MGGGKLYHLDSTRWLCFFSETTQCRLGNSLPHDKGRSGKLCLLGVFVAAEAETLLFYRTVSTFILELVLGYDAAVLLSMSGNNRCLVGFRLSLPQIF